MKRKLMNRKLLTAIMAIAAMTALNSCNDDSLEKAKQPKNARK